MITYCLFSIVVNIKQDIYNKYVIYLIIIIMKWKKWSRLAIECQVIVAAPLEFISLLPLLYVLKQTLHIDMFLLKKQATLQLVSIYYDKQDLFAS